MKWSDWAHFIVVLGIAVGLVWLANGKPPHGETILVMTVIVAMGTVVRAVRSTQPPSGRPRP